MRYKHSAPPEHSWCFPLFDELTSKSASELVALIRSRAVSPVEVVEAHLRRIEQVNPSLNAIVTIAENAIDCARECEAQLLSGRDVGPLHGLPVTVKDTIDTAGLRTTSGSRLFVNHVPKQDAIAVARLRGAGAIILGKSNVPEMAIPYECDNPVFGRTNNPYDLKRTAGGSSGGEAAAIAAGMSPAGLGSDLSGSIRVPAHFCGVAGLKPTTGRVPMHGHTPAALGVVSLGAGIGPMARRVEDLALLSNLYNDPMPSEAAKADWKSLRGLRVAWYAYDGFTPVADEIRAVMQTAADVLAGAGLQVVEAIPPGIANASRLWIDLFSRAANVEIVTLYRGREHEAGPRVATLLSELKGAPVELDDKIETAERAAAAVFERERLREELLGWMIGTPLILAPVGATVAFEHGSERVDVDGKSISQFRAFSYAQAFNVFGLPSVAVPAGRTANGLPIGVQIAGRPFDERVVLSAAAIIEAALGTRASGVLPLI